MDEALGPMKATTGPEEFRKSVYLSLRGNLSFYFDPCKLTGGGSLVFCA